MKNGNASRRSQLLAAALALFVAALAVSWVFHGTGVVRNDQDRNIYIPRELTMPLQVKAAYNGELIFFRYRWPAARPSIYHDMMRFEGGKWVQHGKSVPGPEPEGIYEDRLTMLVDDGSVPEFEKYGGYITIGDAMRFFTREAKAEAVKAHPYLGKKKNQTEVRKHLPETRIDINDWASVVPEERLAAQRKAGYFLDLWHWRAHRSNPIGKSDDEFVAEGRFGDTGKAVFFENWDREARRPRLMFDPAKTGGRSAIAWDDLEKRRLGFDDLYYMREDQAKAFDPAHPWKDGDVLPRRVLRPGDGSHADISVAGNARWKDGYWELTLVRKMDTGNPEDDKIFLDQRAYTVAFAVHRDSLGSRWHYVSLPKRVGLERSGDFKAVKFQGAEPKWDQPWLDVQLFYPGQVSWPMLNSARHAGAGKIRQGVPLKFRHSEIQLAHYGVEMGFNDEIVRQWRTTLLGGILLIAGFAVALILLLPGKDRRR
jgi:hypothetical protein